MENIKEINTNQTQTYLTKVINIKNIQTYLLSSKQQVKLFKSMGNIELMNYHEGIVFFIENVLKIKI